MSTSAVLLTVGAMTATDTAFNPAKVEAFAGKLLPILSGALVSHMIDLGDRTGLFASSAEGGTSQEIAERAGAQERYVREWLGCMAISGIIDYDVTSDTYSLAPEHAMLLVGPGSMTPMARANTTLAPHVTGVARAFREGGGVPYSDYAPEFTEAMDGLGRGAFDQFLVQSYLPMAPGLTDLLTAGATAADFACGTGHALVVLAQAYPNSTFTGYDSDPFAIDRAKAEAAELGLKNVTFELTDILEVAPKQPLDAAFMFDALHDQVDPAGVLATVHRALRPGGTFLLREPHAADDLAGNLGDPMSAVMYAVSTLHCLTVSLAHDGAGIGTAFGEGLARRLLREAGFQDPAVQPAPGHPFDAVYVTRRA